MLRVNEIPFTLLQSNTLVTELSISRIGAVLPNICQNMKIQLYQLLKYSMKKWRHVKNYYRKKPHIFNNLRFSFSIVV